MVLGDRTADVGCSLRVFKRGIVERIPFFKNFHRFFTYLVGRYGFSVKEVAVAHHRRIAGKSKYSNAKRLWEGIFDLWGVFWLTRRMMIYDIKRES